MSTVLGKKLFHLRHGIIHMVSFDRTAGSLHTVLTFGQDEYRMMIFFPDFPGNDSRNTFMDLRKIDHHDLIFCHMMFLNICIGPLDPLYCQVLAAFI